MMQKKHGRKARKASGGRGETGNSPAHLGAPLRMIAGAQKQERLWNKVAVTYSSLSTNASGYLGVVPLCSNSNATSSADWSALSAVALEWRCLCMEVDVIPVQTDITSLTSPPPNAVSVCSWSSGLAPVLFADVVGGPGGKMHQLTKGIQRTVSVKGFNDGLLFAATNATPPSGNTYGLTIADPGSIPAGPVSTVVARIVVKYLVQFRSLD